MSQLKRKKKDVPPSAPITRHSYQDNDGIPRVVLLPAGENDVEAGIPVSLDLTPLFGHMPPKWQRELYAALHANGLVEPQDYLKPGASDRFRAAMFSVIAHDFLSVQTLVKEVLK